MFTSTSLDILLLSRIVDIDVKYSFNFAAMDCQAVKFRFLIYQVIHQIKIRSKLPKWQFTRGVCDADDRWEDSLLSYCSGVK